MAQPEDRRDRWLDRVAKIVGIVGGIGALIFGAMQLDQCRETVPTPEPPTLTPVPPTLTPVPPTRTPDPLTPTPSPPVVEIMHIEYDPPQPEGEEDWQYEFVTLRNTSADSQEMSYWTLEEADGRVFTFPEFILPPGASVKVWTAEGANSATDLYWNLHQSVWDNEGPDAATLRDHRGQIIDEFSYLP